MGNELKISVIIPTYNSARYIKEAIDSVLTQTLLPFEIIVVDDGSTDNTKRIITPYIELEKVTYIKKKNNGAASARNIGIKMAKGELIAFLDADDIWLPEKLAKQTSLFSDSNIGLVYSRRSFLPNYKLDEGLLYAGVVTKELIKNNFITNSSVIIRKIICDKIGFFREEKRFIAIEDYDFWLRASIICQFGYSNNSLVYYRIHNNQSSNVHYSIILKNIIKLYIGMIFTSQYKNFRSLIFLKIIQNVKGCIFYKIKILLQKTKNKIKEENRFDPVKNISCTEFEVNNWTISRFVIKKLIPIVGFRPFPLNELSLMVSVVCFFRPTHIFEWGTHIGKSARIFYETAKYFNIPVKIHSVDLPDDIFHVEHPGYQRGKLVKRLKNIFLHQGDGLNKSLEIIKNISDEFRPLFYIDGDHSYESVKRELMGIMVSAPNATILLHDTFYQSAESHYNIGPWKAINEMVSSPDNQYKKIELNTGLPGMTLLYK
ncbi:MAG: glycosyltransferase [Patescibacteria group bacterium]|nr:glycosyltransferase [bacterium]MBU1987455.1 glycosyltransferase [Patescibacteria group bacterium]MBU2415703.1 glycosyltransferase [Patescibacteria group bacterium]